MAFLLPLELGNTGVAASYWRITHIQVDRNAGVIETVLHGFRDEAARRDGKAPLDRLAFRLRPENLQDPEAMTLDDIYDALRQAPASPGAGPVFANATNV